MHSQLVCKVTWDVAIHDGPVTLMTRSPHNPHLMITMGGYSWALWNESDQVGLACCNNKTSFDYQY